MTGVAEDRVGVALDVLRSPRRVVMATLADVGGSAPMDPGTFMLVDDQGGVEGSVTGGCVEGDIVNQANAIFESSGPPRYVTYGISDELAGSVGLMCGGTAYVFIEELRDQERKTVVRALEAVKDGTPVALATVLEGEHAGTKLAVIGKQNVGSLGGPAMLDNNVARDAAGLLDQGVTTIRRYGDDGETQGDALPVQVTSFAEPPQMLIFGAIDFAAALAPLAKELGYNVWIYDARAPFLQSPRFSRAATVGVDWPDRAIAAHTLGPRDAVLIFTHDSKFDEPAVFAALETDVGYIGVLGSRQTTIDRERRLRAAGATQAQLDRLFAPAGLDIGASTPAETAVAILGEIIAAGAGRRGESLIRTAGPIRARGQH
jgi:xanthine dehydrogenase accessory factor